MKSVLSLSSSRWALLAAFGLAAASYTPAAAADLGGDCCADLEERVAELEATTARKGNRKVSLTVSGWVNEQVMWWNDGTESNAYVGTNSLEQSRVRFVGEAQIAPGYSAGYTLELGLQGAPLNQFTQSQPDGSNSNTVTVRKSNWWLKSKDLGKVTVGLEGTAMYHVLDDADAANTRNFYDAEADGVYQGAFQLRGAGIKSSLTWSNLLAGPNNNTPGQDGRRNIVRYDSPTIAGFTFTASWGEDDNWGMSLTYANTWGDFKLLGKAGYGQNADENTATCHNNGSSFSSPPGSTTKHQDCELFGAAATVMHVPTGIYVYGGYGQTHDNAIENAPLSTGAPVGDVAGLDADHSMYFIQGGIEQKWLPIGKTTIYGQYRHDDAGSNPTSNNTGANDFIRNAKLNFWTVGVVQNVEPAAMDLYVMYRQGDGDVTFNTTGTKDIDTFQAVIAGGLIKF
ncbi:porin [Hyphomicrobium sp.]|uniref:porin n=1 Tax=Hyphomicrobium sp. TaxID=82 RepID=UPI000F9E7670|nr:porin [Hyphomicrobium sp.]RUO99020.1 MAG: porin [Hyphomicrobium sp.]